MNSLASRTVIISRAISTIPIINYFRINYELKDLIGRFDYNTKHAIHNFTDQWNKLNFYLLCKKMIPCVLKVNTFLNLVGKMSANDHRKDHKYIVNVFREKK